MNRSKDFQAFRDAHRTFTYSRCKLEPADDGLNVSFEFDLDGQIHFKPSLRFPKPADGWKIDPVGPLAARMAFCIGMVELISYWKTFCPAQVNVLAHPLCEEEMVWWKKLYYFGLGEFFYTNGIETDPETFLNLTARDTATSAPFSLPRTGRNLIPVGGGKDSIVSLELLRDARAESNVLLLKAPRAAKECALLAGYAPGQIVEVGRTLDPRLLELNAAGALNGHTPFSALLAFAALFAAALTGAQSIVLSNESSANEATVPGSHVNHQYSKSFAFEEDFRSYAANYLTSDIDYFSLLRPINELQIASLMSAHARYLPVFRSCNEGSREGRWCGRCAKCLFAFLMIQPFCTISTMTQIFGRDLLDDVSLQDKLEQLLGLTETKPFDCVGTVEEVRTAVSLIVSDPAQAASSRRLLEFVRLRHPEVLVTPEAARALLREWNPEHRLPPDFERRLRKSPLFQP